MQTKESGNDGEKLFKESQKEEVKDKLESTRKDAEKILEEILDQESSKASSKKDSKNLIVENYGLNREEVDLFNYYANKTKAYREEMKDFWKKLIGSAKKEVSVEKNRQAKGKLNVNDLIYSYPEFVEAEKKEITKILKSLIKIF